MDELTGLLNRRKYNEVMDLEWRRSLRQRTPLTLIIADIDYFKNYNDTYGHIKGDECLRFIGQALRETFKRGSEHTARYGGEEFAIILANTDARDGALACERLIESVAALNIPHSHSEAANIVTVSAGMVSIIPKEGDRLEAFINQADLAMYAAKGAGRNRYAVADTGNPEDDMR
jgi:diguanylate cyclase (GGDEF)-like protein